MEQLCTLCKANAVDEHEQSSVRSITGGVCSSCNRRFTPSSDAATLNAFVDAINAPVLVMQAEPRQVYTANRKALELFKKEPERIEKHQGGQVFDCVYAFTEAGCGKDVHCRPCKIKNAIVVTLSAGSPGTTASAVLDIKKGSAMNAYALQVTTEKIGDMALVRIDRYEPML
jgi:transcriptional regulator of aromatic amino acid metabolism